MISLADRVKETSLSAGTGPLKLDGAALGFSSFGDYYSYNSTIFYAVTDGVDYEVGSGQYFLNGSDNSLSRYPFASSNSGNLVNFSYGLKEVFVTYPAKYAVFKDNGGIILESGIAVPQEITNKLYNISGVLYFNGSQLMTGSGANQSIYAKEYNILDQSAGGYGAITYNNNILSISGKPITTQDQVLLRSGGTLSGNLSFNTTNAGLRLNNLTTTQMNNLLATSASGDLVYNTSLNRAHLRNNTAWVQLLDSSGNQTINNALSVSGNLNIGRNINAANDSVIYIPGVEAAAIKFIDYIDEEENSIYGTQIGTGVYQNLGFYGSTPISQPSSSDEISDFYQNRPGAITNGYACTASLSTNLITAPGHNFQTGDSVVFTYLDGGRPLDIFKTYTVSDINDDEFELLDGVTPVDITLDMTAGFVVKASDDYRTVIVYNNSTFTGGIGTTAYHINDIVKHLKNLGLIAL